ncbi:DUF2268 domain-containing putative Zn-dependent protease [Pedobacter sp.]|uniref:DUF2268 domain-containing putative Zn-dependent protease n=1 Tax=Pedobacter sp. TaxID=1411316 RepID=UPI003D7FBD44
MKLLRIIVLAFFPLITKAQNVQTSQVSTSDIDHFWIAYDSAKTTSDTLIQRQYIQKLYIDKGSVGLQAFMKARDYDAKLWVELINKYPKFWTSIRKNTLQAKMQAKAIEASINQFRKLYPEMRAAKMYFTIGGLRSGGTTKDDMVLVGAEIATADQATDATELSDWLKNIFENQKEANLVSINVHEYVHTQQKLNGHTLLAQSIREGSADFISELVTGKIDSSAYTVYGRQHEAQLKELFKIDMFSTETSNWLYNGSNAAYADLGYFMGYTICKSYYKNQPNKRKAVKDIIELNYQDSLQVLDFLTTSKYYAEPLNPAELLKKFEALRPYVVNLSPDINLKTDVATTLTELTFNFSQPMEAGKSISFGEGGKEHFPLTKITGFSEDRKTFKVNLSLAPNKDYNFVITGKGFKSQAGYPLKEYTVHFKTNKAK